MTLSEADLLKMFVDKERQEAERKAVAEYAACADPRNLLRDRIYSIIACSANMVIDAPYEQRNARLPEEWGQGSWEKNSHATVDRLNSEPMFHRLVNMQANEIIAEVERYNKGISRHVCRL